MAERIYDKINLPTNTTDIGTYANYLTGIRGLPKSRITFLYRRRAYFNYVANIYVMALYR